ncbi:hypothetical protein RGQ29_007186 [Quercus rubra]|uniref:Endonuclease/exonuclease/phosphatase domain-containing protein n=1 Tax=Quercus rubra TaxID=3512 RepID=A0AAN7DWL1_QUERU|nr:hypothetical protein RGQ29_007186 [Quercus rubra]
MLKALPALPCRLPIFPSFKRIVSNKMSTTPSPIYREFISVEGSDSNSRSRPDGIRFRLVSYNILAQVYVKSSLFPHSPSPCLRWKARSQAILSVLKNFGADFLCLQRNGQKRDGCGIFYKQKSAELVLEAKIEYNDLVNSIQDGQILGDDKHDVPTSGNIRAEPENGLELKKAPEDHGDPNDPRVRLKRDCVGIMAAFKLKDLPDHVVIVANTHLYWDPEWADVKLAQAKYLLSRLALFRTLVSNRLECTPSVVVAGDFNSTPGDKVYQYLISGNSPLAPAVECLEDMPIPLCSVYAFTRGEPPFTNCTPDFTNTLDYILFSPTDNIKPVSFLELPELDSSDVVGGLPNYSHPSDHLPIGADFEITRD